jgi:hypothetical protein
MHRMHRGRGTVAAPRQLRLPLVGRLMPLVAVGARARTGIL